MHKKCGRFLSNEAISIAVRDFFKIYHILGVKLVLTNIILSTIYQINNLTISKVLHEILHQIILYYQQGNKSLRETTISVKSYKGNHYIHKII